MLTRNLLKKLTKITGNIHWSFGSCRNRFNSIFRSHSGNDCREHRRVIGGRHLVILSTIQKILIIKKKNRGAAIAQWIRLCLPSCRPGFESQVHHLRFFQFLKLKLFICHSNWNVKRTKINKKRLGLANLSKW